MTHIINCVHIILYFRHQMPYLYGGIWSITTFSPSFCAFCSNFVRNKHCLCNMLSGWISFINAKLWCLMVPLDSHTLWLKFQCQKLCVNIYICIYICVYAFSSYVIWHIYIQQECHSVLVKLHPITFYRTVFLGIAQFLGWMPLFIFFGLLTVSCSLMIIV